VEQQIRKIDLSQEDALNRLKWYGLKFITRSLG